MKKYKLIKEYPGYIGDLGLEAKWNDEKSVFEFSNHCEFIVYMPEEYLQMPEFWQEVKEPTYPIISAFIYIPTNILYVLREEDGMYVSYNNCGYSFEEFFKGGILIDCYAIYSVDTSDTETFKINDFVCFNIKSSIKHAKHIKWHIDNFYVTDANVILARSENNVMVETVTTIIHVKEPLFITEDDTPIYPGDHFWWVNINENVVREFVCDFDTCIKDRKAFTTKEAGNKYINLNKKRYSIKDIEEAIEASKYKNNGESSSIMSEIKLKQYLAKCSNQQK